MKITILAAALAVGLVGCRAEAPQVQVEPAAESRTVAAVSAAVEQSGVHRFEIGTLQAFVLKDGDIEVANDGATIAQGQPKADTDAVLTAAGLPTDTLRLSVQSLLVRSADRVLLFDTGAGSASFVTNGARLPQSLRAAGLEATDVTDIFLSHAHPDHAGGLVGDDGKPAFPNATIRLSAPEWASLQAADDATLATAIAPQVETFVPDSNVLPGVTALAVDGHTPGHSAYVISDGDAHLFYIGDSAHHHVISVQRPRWTIAFDGDAPVAEASREALLDRLADEAVLVSSPHFPFPGVGRIERRDGSFAWVPSP